MKKNKNLLCFCFFLLMIQVSVAQEKTITGVISSKADGLPLPGVNIIVKGTVKGVETDFDGKYKINASSTDILMFSFVGMESSSVLVGNKSVINVQLSEGTLLKEVVVTALGIKKERKSLTYSAQDVKGDDLTRVKQTNPINSLSGKSAGLTITRSSSGAGGAAKVVLRGNSSTTNNDPLYVVDGIPMSNSGNGSNGEEPGTSVFGGHIGNRDGGDVLSMINPDDIESMTILKGASAAALYGSQGANGVVLITTKSGKEGKLTVNFNSSLTVDNVMSLPKLQSEYQSISVGQVHADPIERAKGRVVDAKSWGAKTSGLSNDAESFFNTGYTAVQSMSLSAGTEKAQTYFSYANTVAKGVVPKNKMMRNNFSLRETAKFLDDKVSVSANISLSDQRINNRPTNGLYSNPLSGLYLHPVGIDRNIYKNKFEYFNPTLNMMDQYATSFDENIQQNPYWLINRNQSKDIAQRVLASLTVKYKINNDFSLQSRGSYDKSFFSFEKKMYGGGDATFAPGTGRYINEKTENTQQYLDLLATYNKEISENVSLTAILGTSLTKYRTGDRTYLDSGQGGLKYPNFFTIANFNGTADLLQSVNTREVQSVFGSANIGFKNKYFLDITARQDWSSTLAEPFFYPSVGLTGVLSDIFEFPEAISFAKLRVSYAEVGKDVPFNTANPNKFIPLGLNTIVNPLAGTLPGEHLVPEKQKGFEIGTEWKLFKGRLGFEFTYYNSNTTDQLIYIPAIAEIDNRGFTQHIVNAGKISNKGIEFILNAKPVATDNFKWNSSINFASNKNIVEELHPSLKDGKADLTLPGVNGYGYSLVEGEDYGSIRGRKLNRNSNGVPMVVVSDTGDISMDATDFETIGHAQPDFTLGWSNNFEINNFNINIMIDAKIGGDVVSVTEAVNDFYGVSQASADLRNKNGGMVDVVDGNGNALQLTAQQFLTRTAGRAGILGEYVYDATNVRLSEVSIGYTLPKVTDFIKSVRFSLIGNNLFFIYKDAPFDPNVTSSTGTGLQGVDIYGQPSTRSVGLNINVNF
ncbi:SusC/RagA family TonB-linked outer membrane protein [Tenacibaculum ovolyticum]|uniref:SusC/RagA family TonB-linked outer membrane protein n=1 Tax=Tenacibaculum ovolyticum TaxID=104270 RepID=UPI001EED518C|nr:SusC/RagA family TonB-linked outer membrane protein [Tenacibaculum ovolyticum]